MLNNVQGGYLIALDKIRLRRAYSLIQFWKNNFNTKFYSKWLQPVLRRKDRPFEHRKMSNITLGLTSNVTVNFSILMMVRLDPLVSRIR